MNLIELKAKVYDLLASRQQIEIELEQVNRKIQDELSKSKEMPKLQEG